MFRQKLTTRHLARLAVAGTLTAGWLCTPSIVLGQTTTSSQTAVPSLDDLQKRLDELKADRARKKRKNQHPVAAPGAPQSSLSPQGFAGIWQLTSLTVDGVGRPQEIRPGRAGQMTVTRDPCLGNQEYRVTSSDTISCQMYYAQQGRRVQTADQANLVETLTWRVDGPTLVFERVFDYGANYYGHPAGKKVWIAKYRRVSPQESSSSAP